MSHQRSNTSGAGITPLAAVLAFTFINSFGGGVVTTGFSFLADAAYGFTPSQNYWLGLLQGAVYVVGALTVGPALGRALRTVTWLSTRRVLVLLMLLLGALCALPWAAKRASTSTDPGAGAWALWTLIAGYSVLTGVLWPIVESYLSGGRSGAPLRRAIGLFNVVWSSSLAFSFWVMGPLKQNYALELVVVVGVAHLVCLGLLLSFSRNPASHGHDDAPPAPAKYRDLLGVFRMELVASYMVYAALGPWLPAACKQLGIAPEWQTPLVSVWLVTRVIAFAALQRWHAWHGRWSTSVGGAVLLLVGFAGAVMSTSVADAAGFAPGLGVMILGLSAFGLGMGTIYCAALYYAMAVGNAQVDAGGKHEALIGTGFGVGPACGLVATAGVSQGLVPAESFNLTMLAMVAVLAIGAIGWALAAALSHARTPSGDQE